jgi:hypothetical protein
VEISTHIFELRAIELHGMSFNAQWYMIYILSMHRDPLFQIVRELDPDGISRRLHDLQRHCGEYIVPGPNFIWSVDGYCKLEHWGIEIYAAIDAYSRYVIWCYVGISNRTAISVVSQYIDALRDGKVQPRHIRSDHGVETSLLSAAHLKVAQTHEPSCTMDKCYWYGTSTANQHIESWWGQLTKSMLFRTRVCPLYYEWYLSLCSNKV